MTSRWPSATSAAAIIMPTATAANRRFPVTLGSHQPSVLLPSLLSHIRRSLASASCVLRRSSLSVRRHAGATVQRPRQRYPAYAQPLALEDIGWGTAEHWMRMQTSYDLAQARSELTAMTAV